MKRHIFISLFLTAFILSCFSDAGAAGLRGNIVDPASLPDELKSVKIENDFIDSKNWPVGTVQTLTGNVIVHRKDVNRAYFAASGDMIYQHDVFYTLDDSRCRIRFSTEDVVTMGENGKIAVDEISEDHLNKKKTSTINMLKGKAMFYVVRLFRYKNVSATVKTPTAVMGVRGTKFGVEVREIGEKVADLSDKRLIYLAQNAPSNFQTIVYGFEGNVAVTSPFDGSVQTVGEGQNLVLDNMGAGVVEKMDPSVASRFIGDTEGGLGAGAAGTVGSIAGGGATAGSLIAEGESILEEAGGTDTETIAQALTSQVIEATVASGTRVGYFSALLTRFDGSNTYLQDIYTNSTRSDFNKDSVSGNSIVNSIGFISATGTVADESTPYLTKIKTEPFTPFDSGDLGTSFQMDNPTDTPGWPANDTLGENSYMKWGFWAMSRWVPTTPSPYSYAVTDRAYYLDGVTTPDDAVAGMAGSYTYAGSAWGTYFDGGGGTDMVGTFNCGIDMTARTVTNFDMSVSGGGKSASIINATGSFNGSSGEFNITGGTWELGNPSPLIPVSKSCTGSLFGPNAEHMGGAWAMDYGSGNNAAVGIFIGDKNGTPTTPAMPPPIP
jgi:hypothetical protein